MGPREGANMWGGQRPGAAQPGLRLNPLFAQRAAAIHQGAAGGAAVGWKSTATPVAGSAPPVQVPAVVSNAPAGLATWKPLNGGSIPTLATTPTIGTTLGAAGLSAQPS